MEYVLGQAEGNGSQQEKRKSPLSPCYSHSNLQVGFFCCCFSTMLCNYWFEWFCRLKIKFLIEYKWVWKISNWQSFSLLTFITVGMFPNWRSCNITISFKILYAHVLWDFILCVLGVKLGCINKLNTCRTDFLLNTSFLGESWGTLQQPWQQLPQGFWS